VDLWQFLQFGEDLSPLVVSLDDLVITYNTCDEMMKFRYEDNVIYLGVSIRLLF